MNDPLKTYEALHLKDFREQHARGRSRMQIIEEFRDTCARRRGPKDDMTLMRLDVGALYTKASRAAADLKAPKLLGRVREAFGRVVTIGLDLHRKTFEPLRAAAVVAESGIQSVFVNHAFEDAPVKPLFTRRILRVVRLGAHRPSRDCL